MQFDFKRAFRVTMPHDDGGQDSFCPGSLYQSEYPILMAFEAMPLTLFRFKKLFY
jgi:hypothetical protein